MVQPISGVDTTESYGENTKDLIEFAMKPYHFFRNLLFSNIYCLILSHI